jgi:uncharacterized protein YwqG
MASGVAALRGGDSVRWYDVADQAAGWRLLFQLDSDADLGLLWGDAGTLYWAAPRSALAERAWTDVWFTFQCS